MTVTLTGNRAAERESMAADLSPDHDFDCPICQEVFKMPIRTRSCRHVFCKGCFQMAVRSQGPHCPMCRGPVSERERGATDIQKRMREQTGKCKSCGIEKLLSKMRQHYKHCRSYIEEFGILPEAAVPPLTSRGNNMPDRTMPIPQPITRAPPVGGALPLFNLMSDEGRAVRVYACPYCPLQDLRDMALVQHCSTIHATEMRPVVCPICAGMTWGDPGYCSRNLIAHMRLRHRISYAAYMDEQEAEYSQVARALQLSYLES